MNNDLSPEEWQALGSDELVRRIETAGFSVSGPGDFRAAENGEPVWVCNARAALAEVTTSAREVVEVIVSDQEIRSANGGSCRVVRSGLLGNRLVAGSCRHRQRLSLSITSPLQALPSVRSVLKDRL